MDNDQENGKVKTWRHLNDEVRIKGLTGPQLGLGIIFLMTSMMLGYLALLVLAIELFLWFRLLKKQKDSGDPNVLMTKRVLDASPKHIQDKQEFFQKLRAHEN